MDAANRKSANFFPNLAGQLLAFRQSTLRGGIAGSVDYLRQHDGLESELLTGDVVKIARDVAAFIILELEQPAGKLTEHAFVGL